MTRSITFYSHKITVLNESLEPEDLKRIFHSNFRESTDERKHEIEVAFHFEPKENNGFIKITYSVSLKEQPDAKAGIEVETVYKIRDLKKHSKKNDDTGFYEFRDKKVFFRLIDNAVAHTRSIFAIKIGAIVDDYTLIPTVRASDILREENAVIT